jgi:hypothetical protein
MSKDLSEIFAKIHQAGLVNEEAILRKTFVELSQIVVKLQKEVNDLDMQLDASYGRGKKRKKWDDE